MQTQQDFGQCPTNPLLLLAMLPSNRFLAPYIARPYFWETRDERFKEKQSNIRIILLRKVFFLNVTLT